MKKHLSKLCLMILLSCVSCAPVQALNIWPALKASATASHVALGYLSALFPQRTVNLSSGGKYSLLPSYYEAQKAAEDDEDKGIVKDTLYMKDKDSYTPNTTLTEAKIARSLGEISKIVLMVGVATYFEGPQAWNRYAIRTKFLYAGIPQLFHMYATPKLREYRIPQYCRKYSSAIAISGALATIGGLCSEYTSLTKTGLGLIAVLPFIR